jgi:polar amino acid transport system substrate-binding protein
MNIQSLDRRDTGAAERRFRRIAMSFAAVGALAQFALPGPTAARTLEAISQRGMIALCAHPKSLPFASKKGDRAGFQIELGQAIADRIGVSLARRWVVNSFQIRRADCDIVMDAIGDRAALIEFGLKPSRPYQRSGVVLAVRDVDRGVASLHDLGPGRRVGVQVGSIASMLLDKRGVETTPFAFEDDMVEALARREVDAIVVTRASAGYHNLTHPAEKVRVIPAFDDEPDLNWNVAVGMLKPDDKLRERIDSAIQAMLADGTIAGIYARYGIEARPPQ